jgi:hypothetical protein
MEYENTIHNLCSNLVESREYENFTDGFLRVLDIENRN